MELNALLKTCDSHVSRELTMMPEVDDMHSFDPTVDVPPIEARRWFRVEDVVAVVADLKSSTKLGVNKYAQSTASIYEAALRPVVDIFYEFGAAWIPVQGDCVFGLFWDDTAVERAMCAGITAKTFSEKHLVTRLEAKWPELPETGLKIGVAMDNLLVKRVGRPRTPHQALVWPGKAINYAVKAAQSSDAGELVVTGSVADAIDRNDYLTFTCDCSMPSPSLWQDHIISKLDHDDAEADGQRLTSSWCVNCGEKFCNSILDGETHRDSVDEYRSLRQKSLRQDSLQKKRARDRQRARERRQVRAHSR